MVFGYKELWWPQQLISMIVSGYLRHTSRRIIIYDHTSMGGHGTEVDGMAAAAGV